jgi:thiol-disulfide isomerase/thioredoxin
VVAIGAIMACGSPSGLLAQGEDVIGLPVGASPPAVTIEDLQGRPVDLGQWIGKKPVLLEFWATWCPQCEALLPRLEAAHARYGGRMEFLVVAVAVNQSPRGIQRHVERHPMPFRVLWDTNGRATRAFQAPATSYVVVLDAKGRVVYTGMGAEQNVITALQRAVGG